LANINNHHNFAWKEEIVVNQMNAGSTTTAKAGQYAIVHRKGATPAGKGVAGFIPGSMATAGYLVCGRGVSESLNSASHGAGRAMSRQKAKEQFTQSALKKFLTQRQVSLIGGSIEEMPQAYKDIDKVMPAQASLVDIHGKFTPRIVRMNKE